MFLKLLYYLFQVIDIWMLVSNFYPFVIVICQTLIHHIENNNASRGDKVEIIRESRKVTDVQEDGSNSTIILLILERFCKIILPVMGICFVCSYWTFGYLL